jgi:hypothetical protein
MMMKLKIRCRKVEWKVVRKVVCMVQIHHHLHQPDPLFHLRCRAQRINCVSSGKGAVRRATGRRGNRILVLLGVWT